MAEKVKVLLNCVYVDNPFHECSQSCLKKIAEGQTRKEKKKSNDGNGVIRTHPACPKASNPYHECGELCPKRVAGAEVRRDKNESGCIWCCAMSDDGHDLSRCCSNAQGDKLPLLFALFIFCTSYFN
ncbi:hypothetical protein ACB092_05G082200 [Castanea dentata]